MHLQEYLESREDGNPALFVTLRAPLGEYRLVGRRGIDTTLQYAMVKQSNVKIAHRNI